MALKIIRNDITKMNTDAIVNTANDHATVGTGCDSAIYNAAGYDELLEYRKSEIGFVPEGEAFITPGFKLQAKYIIHAVSPMYIDGNSGEDDKLRSCYRNSLRLAVEKGCGTIAFPLIATGSFGYPKEEGLRIAVDEINAFLMSHDMLVYLVVFDEKGTELGSKIYPDLERYIDQNYVDAAETEEYRDIRVERREESKKMSRPERPSGRRVFTSASRLENAFFREDELEDNATYHSKDAEVGMPAELDTYAIESSLGERMKHLTDTFSEYLLYMIEQKDMQNADVYKRAIVDKKTFSKIKNNPDYHPQKLTALCLCVGARLNLDETKDLLARAGYALSPCDKTDIIFSYFIENELYDMIEIDIQLEEHGLPCIIK